MLNVQENKPLTSPVVIAVNSGFEPASAPLIVAPEVPATQLELPIQFSPESILAQESSYQLRIRGTEEVRQLVQQLFLAVDGSLGPEDQAVVDFLAAAGESEVGLQLLRQLAQQETRVLYSERESTNPLAFVSSMFEDGQAIGPAVILTPQGLNTFYNLGESSLLAVMVLANELTHVVSANLPSSGGFPVSEAEYSERLLSEALRSEELVSTLVQGYYTQQYYEESGGLDLGSYDLGVALEMLQPFLELLRPDLDLITYFIAAYHEKFDPELNQESVIESLFEELLPGVDPAPFLALEQLIVSRYELIPEGGFSSEDDVEAFVAGNREALEQLLESLEASEE